MYSGAPTRITHSNNWEELHFVPLPQDHRQLYHQVHEHWKGTDEMPVKTKNSRLWRYLVTALPISLRIEVMLFVPEWPPSTRLEWFGVKFQLAPSIFNRKALREGKSHGLLSFCWCQSKQNDGNKIDNSTAHLILIYLGNFGRNRAILWISSRVLSPMNPFKCAMVSLGTVGVCACAYTNPSTSLSYRCMWPSQ